jgi:hypothetical protein
MLPVPDQCVQVGDHNHAATTNAGTPVSDVDSPLAQHLSLAQGQTMPTQNDAAARGLAACMNTIYNDYSIEMEDVDEFMESVLEDDQMKPFMGTDRLDTPLYQDVTEDVTESHGSQEDLDWYTHSQSTGIITSMAQGQTMPTPNDAAATGPAACMHTIDDDYSVGMEDVDEFMESVLEDDQMKPFKGTDRLDTPLYQDVTEDVTESHGSQEDLDWYTHSQSTGIITSMDDRKVSASSQVTTPQRARQAKSSTETVTVPATTRLITVPNANSVVPLQSQEQRASPHDLSPHDRAMTAFSSLSSATMLQQPMVCKPLTAYNYFYRVERDNIVNGMTSATDPLLPVDLDIGREKQEKLLQQHW